MKQAPITFLFSGLVAGLICVLFRYLGSPEAAIIGLAWGVGPLFFVAVLAGIVLTGGRHFLQFGLLRYVAGLLVCTFTYLAALVAFLGVMGYSPDWFGFVGSANVVEFGINVWLGLLAAGAVGTIGVSLFALLLTKKWSTALLLRLLIAGLLTICLTFLINFPFRSDWSFLGGLFPSGNALFCYVIGAHLWRQRGVERHVGLHIDGLSRFSQ